METLIKKTIIKKEKTVKTVIKKAPKKRILGNAKGKMWVSPDCWDDDFDDEKS